MNRLFSIRRRRPHLVDLWTPRVAGVDGYRLKWGANFSSAPPTTFITSTNVGFIDSNVNRNTVETQPLNGQVRIVFDPTTYSITDSVSFWLQFVPVTGGVEGTPGAMTLVLPANMGGSSLITIAGTPTGTQQLDLPMIRDITVQNAASITIATESGGAAFTIPGSAADVHSLGFLGMQSTLYVTGGAFSLAAALVVPR
jgi:hypothetical protein